MLDRSALERIGLDTEAGLAYCADDPEFYEEMLEAYAAEGRERAGELRRFFDARAWADYAIRAHSVKSTSRMIGAEALSEKARELESAAKQGNAQAILDGHDAFMAEYEALIGSLRAMIG